LKYFLFLVIWVPFSGRSQTLQGTVTDFHTGKGLFPVTVVNTRTQEAVLTDIHGFYVVPARQGDLVAFSYVGYKTVKRIKPVSVIIATLNVSLEQTDLQLDEVRVLPGLSKYQRDSAENVAIYKITLQRTPPNPFSSPIGALAEKFSKTAKRAYAFQKNFYAGETEKFIDTRYKPELVTQLTGLTGDSIGHFMYAYPMPYDYARSATDLEIKMWIRSNFREWIKNQPADTTAALPIPASGAK